MPDLWILREAESGAIVGCVFAKIEAKEDGSPYVYIGLLAVKVGNQVSFKSSSSQPLDNNLYDLVHYFSDELSYAAEMLGF